MRNDPIKRLMRSVPLAVLIYLLLRHLAHAVPSDEKHRLHRGRRA